MRNNFFLSVIAYLLCQNAFAQEQEKKWEAGLFAGNYYNLHTQFRQPRNSHSEGIYLQRKIKQKFIAEILLQRGAFSYYTPGFSTFGRGINSKYVDLNLGFTFQYHQKLNASNTVYGGLGLAYSRHYYTEPGYSVFMGQTFQGDYYIYSTQTDHEFRYKDISIPVVLNWKYAFKPSLNLNLRFQHYLQPIRDYELGYGTSLLFGMGYVF